MPVVYRGARHGMFFEHGHDADTWSKTPTLFREAGKYSYGSRNDMMFGWDRRDPTHFSYENSNFDISAILCRREGASCRFLRLHNIRFTSNMPYVMRF